MAPTLVESLFTFVFTLFYLLRTVISSMQMDGYHTGVSHISRFKNNRLSVLTKVKINLRTNPQVTNERSIK
jgi:hypothetical protein